MPLFSNYLSYSFLIGPHSSHPCNVTIDEEIMDKFWTLDVS